LLICFKIVLIVQVKISLFKNIVRHFSLTKNIKASA